MNARDPLALPLEAALAAALASLREQLRRLAAGEPAVVEAQRVRASTVPTIAFLQRTLGLSAFDADVLLLCAAMALDTRIAAACAAAAGDPARSHPTFALAMTLFADASWDALSPHGPLRYWRLVEVQPAGPLPVATSPLRADDRIVDFVKGLNAIDERIACGLVPLTDASYGPLPPSQRVVADAVSAGVARAIDAGATAVVQLTGIDPASKRRIALDVTGRLGLQLWRAELATLPTTAVELDAWCRLWRRECRLLPLMLYLEARDPAAADATDPALVSGRLLDRLRESAFIDTRDHARIGDGERSDLLVVAVDKPTAEEQTLAWHAALGADAGDLAPRLAAQFNLDLSRIATIARQARDAGGDRRSTAAAVWTACREGTQPRLDTLARRIVVKADWDDLVVPADTRAQLEQIVAQVAWRRRVYGDWGFERRMNRGLGLCALFHGDSGTGKTMAAEVIANALQLDLYRIDLSAVVSKYIGETEKNLQRIFDAAEDGGAILFFDEADALFGKRGEVRDSVDHYANIETNYLLQRIEQFRGLAILGTNQKAALDAAFMRRLRFVVAFVHPGPRERERMWAKAFPRETPTDGLDVAKLAQLDCTGGSIHNIALNAAFLAADRRAARVTTSLVLEAARGELVKLGRPIHEAEFRLDTDEDRRP